MIYTCVFPPADETPGKSIFLRIILVLRLCARLPTFYQVTPSSTIFFSGRGPVVFVPNSFELYSCLKDEPSAWALFDSTRSFKEPPDDFLTSKSFIIQTPSPCTDRIDWKSKFPPVFIFCLELWTPEELICAYVTTFIMNITLIHSTVHRFSGVA